MRVKSNVAVKYGRASRMYFYLYPSEPVCHTFSFLESKESDEFIGNANAKLVS